MILNKILTDNKSESSEIARKICNRKTVKSDIYQNFTEIQKPAIEILTNVPEGVKPENFYFEPVPIYLTNRIFI